MYPPRSCEPPSPCLVRAQRYDGGFDADERSGEGTLVDSEGGALYSGEWRRDRRDATADDGRDVSLL